jgi:hypothetical protein
VKARLVVQRQAGFPIARLRIHVRGGVPYPGGVTVSAKVEDFTVQTCKRHA